MNSLYIFLAIGIWAFFGIIIANKARKKLGGGVSEFYIGGRKAGGFVSALTYAATTFSAFMMVGLVGLVFDSGVVAMGFELIYILSTVVLLFVFAPRFWVASKEYGYSTPPDLLADRFGDKRVGVISAGLSMIWLIPYASAQLMGIGVLFSIFTGGTISYMTGVLLMAVFSGVAAVLAGFKSVSWTDAFQGMTMLIASLILLFFVFNHFYGGTIQFFSTISMESPDLLSINWDIQRFIGMTLPWAFFAVSNPQVSQRLFVSKNIKSIKRMIVGFSIFALIYTIVTTLFGFSISNLIGQGVLSGSIGVADEAMPLLLNNVPIILALITFTGIFAAATSTLGSLILTLSSLGTENIVKPLKPEFSEEKRVKIGRIIILILLAACVLFAIGRFDLIAIVSVWASGGLLVAVPSFFAAFFWKDATAEGVIWSILVAGVLTGALYFSGFNPLGIWPPVWGLLTSIITLVGVSRFTQSDGKGSEFVEKVREEMESYNFK